jgi:hypothetical protein
MADADRPSDSFSLLVEIENVEKKTKSGPAKLKRAKRNRVQKHKPVSRCCAFTQEFDFINILGGTHTHTDLHKHNMDRLDTQPSFARVLATRPSAGGS